MLRLFDFPDPNITSGGRVETTVPLQQLFVLNSEFMAGQRGPSPPGCIAPERPTGDDASRIRRAYRFLYGRDATPRELAIGLEYLRRRSTDPSPAAATRPDLQPLGALCPGPAGR